MAHQVLKDYNSLAIVAQLGYCGTAWLLWHSLAIVAQLGYCGSLVVPFVVSAVAKLL